MANSFLAGAAEFDTEPYFPLDVYFCLDCTLVQLLDVIDPQLLFRNYVYLTGTSETIAEHNRRFAEQLVHLQRLTSGDLVVEVASNDGSLLHRFKPYGVRTLGVEPATNICDVARQSGIETIDEFFDRDLGRAIRESHGPARLVVANNVLAHVDDIASFLQGFRALLADDGLAAIEVPYVKELVDRLEYDTIYHEHLCYFSVTSLVRLFEQADLSIAQIDRVPVHGGSVRVYAGRRERYPENARSVLEMAEEERRAGVGELAYYQRFAERVRWNRKQLLLLLDQLGAERGAVAGYGAPAKGNTLLNYCGIDTTRLPWTVDRNAWKVGRFTPGAHIPILDVSAIEQRKPEHILVLAWNFTDEIMRQQSSFRQRGGKFIVPIPDPTVLKT